MKKVIKSLKLTFIILITLILIGEIYLRVTCKQKLTRWSTHLYQIDNLVGYRYISDTSWYCVTNAYSNLCYTNSLGFPGKEFSITKEAGVTRIIVVGTSDDVGFNTNGPLSYATILDSLFKHTVYRVEVINCSIDGRDRGLLNIKLIENEIINYQPDIILLRNAFPLTQRLRYRETYKNIQINCLYPNEFKEAKNYIDSLDAKRPIIYDLYDYSYIFRYITKYYLDNVVVNKNHVCKLLEQYIYENRSKINLYARRQMYWKWEEKTEKQIAREVYNDDETIKLYVELSNLLLKKNIILILFETNSKGDFLKKIYSEHKLNYISLKIKQNAVYNFGEIDSHSSQKGHEAIARAFYLYFVQELFPKFNKADVKSTVK